MSWLRLGLTGLFGALAGLVLFPRPARGPGVEDGVGAAPDPKVQDSLSPSD